MPPERHPPDDPRSWLARARSDLAIASTRIEGAWLEDLCFHAQQAAEKALKARFLQLGLTFPYSHNLAELVGRLEAKGQVIPDGVKEAVDLTEYAVGARYPGLDEAIMEEEWKKAVAAARRVVEWAENLNNS